MQASTCSLLWWWYKDDTACLMLRLLQKFWNVSKIKLPPASDINLYGMTYTTNMIFTVAITLSAVQPLHSLYYQEFAVIVYNT